MEEKKRAKPARALDKRAHWPVSGGQMGALIATHDWASTPLGPIETWPQSLRTAVDLCLESAVASFVWWGPELIQLYNDAALAIVRAKHPAALGLPAREAWADVWPEVGGMMERVVSTGEAVRGDDVPMVPDRGGLRDTAWFTFSYGPARDEQGAVAGIFCTAIETTNRVRAEAALRASEEKYRTLFETIDQGVHVIELLYNDADEVIDYRFLEANHVFERQTGLKNAVGKRGSEIAPQTESYWLTAYETVARTGKPIRLENYNADTDRWYLAHASRVSEHGSHRVAVVFDDITERKHAETVLRQSDARRGYLLALSDTLRTLDDPDEIQAAACRLLGEHLGVDRAYYVDINETAKIAVVKRDYWRGDSPSLAGTFSLSDYGWVVPYLRRGETVIVEDTQSAAIIPDADREAMAAIQITSHITSPLIKAGRLVGAVCVTEITPRAWLDTEIELVRDTAERVWDAVVRARAEAALGLSEQNLRGVANIVPDLLWYSEPDGSTSWHNDRWMEYTGQTFEQAIGWGWTDAIHPDDCEAVERRYREAFKRNEPVQQELRIRRRDGKYRWFLARTEPLRDRSGRLVRMYGAATDIHDQRAEREELAEQVSVQTTQLHALSRRLLEVQEHERRHLARELHDEIGQALTGLQLQLRALHRYCATDHGDDAGKGDEALAQVETTVRTLTEQVRTLSRDLRPFTLDTLGLLDALIELVQRFEANTGILVDMRSHGLERRLPPELEIAAYRVVQEALTNVARHARVQTAALRALAESDVLTVSIRDEGRGFDVERTSHAGGLGGMRERIGLLGGTFEIESIPGQGTLISAEFPLSKPGDHSLASDPNNIPGEGSARVDHEK